MTIVTERVRNSAHPPVKRRLGRRYLASSAVALIALVWLVPILWAVYVAIRPQEDTRNGNYYSIAHSLTIENFSSAWVQGDIGLHLWNTCIIAIPSVIITLIVSSAAAFGAARYSWRFNVGFLVFFTAGNLVPTQTLAIPVFAIFRAIPTPEFISDSGSMLNSFLAVILMNVAQQTGFCVFVYSNYMKTITREVQEAAQLDGAGPARIYYRVIMPISAPATGALAILLSVWAYNDFFWPLLLLRDSAKYPITNAIAMLNNGHSLNLNVLASGALIAAAPMLAIYIALRRQIASGLTLGSTG